MTSLTGCSMGYSSGRASAWGRGCLRSISGVSIAFDRPSVGGQLVDRRSPTARLSLGALGVGLVLLVSLAWASGVLYVIARLGLPSPVSLALVDGVHVYVGLACLAFFAAKLTRVGLHEHVSGVPDLVAWQRRLSRRLAASYSTRYATSSILLPPR